MIERETQKQIDKLNAKVTEKDTEVKYTEIALLREQIAALKVKLSYWKRIASERVAVNIENTALTAENKRLREGQEVLSDEIKGLHHLIDE